MTYLGRLWRVEACTVLGLIAVALVLWLFAIVTDWRMGIRSPISFSSSIALYALTIGCLPALLFGAPVYALASRLNRASLWLAALIGAVPGIVAWLLASHLMLVAYFLGCGMFVAMITHVSANAWIRHDAAL